MFWNLSSYTGEFRVDSPLGSMNWGIGCIGTDQTGEGYWESWGTQLQPRSLYLQQLEDRLGESAVNNVTTPEQQSGEIEDYLAAWAGQGDFSDGGFSGDIPTVNFINPTSTIDVSVWEPSDIEVEATDSDGTVQTVTLLINGEPLAEDIEAPYIFSDLSSIIQSLSHQIHYLQAIAIDNDGNTSSTRMAILGGDPPEPPEEEEEEEEEEQNLEMQLRPNPVLNGELTIQMEKEGAYTVRIFNLHARQIDAFTFEGIEHLFQCENLSDGIYLIEIKDQEQVLLQRKVIIH